MGLAHCGDCAASVIEPHPKMKKVCHGERTRRSDYADRNTPHSECNDRSYSEFTVTARYLLQMASAGGFGGGENGISPLRFHLSARTLQKKGSRTRVPVLPLLL